MIGFRGYKDGNAGERRGNRITRVQFREEGHIKRAADYFIRRTETGNGEGTVDDGAKSSTGGRDDCLKSINPGKGV